MLFDFFLNFFLQEILIIKYFLLEVFFFRKRDLNEEIVSFSVYRFLK